MIICQNRETKKVKIFKNVKAVLRNINRDRSAEWTPYTARDWKEGLAQFTEYDLLKREG
jgi:hypothetical protein